MSIIEKFKHHVIEPVVACYRYCTGGVWNDTRKSWKVNAVKIVNLSVRNFMDKDLQDKACNLTYRTVLATVPTLAMLFAVGRGFGFQKLMQDELTRLLPAQRQALETSLQFVDNYLSRASQGIFVGIGLLFLLWTLISLMSNVEKAFNDIWGVKNGRSFYRKVVDYTAFFIVLPILIICSAGIQVFMSHTVQSFIGFMPFSPWLMHLLDYTPLLLSWVTFTLAFKLIPATRVHLKGATIAGVIFGSLFYGLELLFVKGQFFVASYNAIYGSFAFVLLLLIWLQWSWLIAMIGAMVNFAIQSKDSYQPQVKQQLQTITQEYIDQLEMASHEIIDKLRARHNAESGVDDDSTSQVERQ